MARKVPQPIEIAHSRLTSKGQLTMPKAMRDEIGVRPGDEVEWTRDGDGVRVKKSVDIDRMRKWKGYLKDLDGKDIDDVVREMRGH